MAKAKVSAFANHKGGVGKTASVSATGSILASQGKRVLMCDLDTQANLTRCHIDGFPKRLIYHALKEKKDLPIINVAPNLDLVPSGLEMAGIELEISGAMQRESILKKLPMLADTMSYYGLGMIDNICLLVQELNPAIQITGIFFTKYDTRVGLTSAIEEMVRETYGSRLMQTKIRINTKIGEAPMFHKNILEYEPDGKSVREYTALVDEMLQLMK